MYSAGLQAFPGLLLMPAAACRVALASPHRGRPLARRPPSATLAVAAKHASYWRMSLKNIQIMSFSAFVPLRSSQKCGIPSLETVF